MKTKTKAFVCSCIFWNKPVTNKPIILCNVILRAWFVCHRHYLERTKTFVFVLVFVFVLAHEQAISKVVKWFLGQLIQLFSFCLPALDYEWNISCCHFFRIVLTYWPMNCTKTRTCPIITSCTKLKNLVSHLFTCLLHLFIDSLPCWWLVWQNGAIFITQGTHRRKYLQYSQSMIFQSTLIH